MKRQKPKVEKKMDSVYLPSLDALVDVLFQEAYDRHWTWVEIAKQSGLSYSTVKKLGMRETNYPQHRTVELLAYALGGTVTFTKSRGKKQQVTWEPKVFAA